MRAVLIERFPVVSMLLLAGCATTGPVSVERLPTATEWPLNETPLNRSAAQLDNDTREHLAWAEAFRTRILEVTDRNTIANTLEPYNDMMTHLDAARSECALFARVHPDKHVREIAEEGERAVVEYLTELTLDRGLYDAFRGLDVTGADDATRFLAYKILRDFRRAGVDKSADVRAQIAELNAEIIELRQEFGRNLREDEREIVLESPAQLAGMPSDWMVKHPADADGKIHVSTRYPDRFPVLTYARDPEVRRRLYFEFKNAGYPANIDTLHELLTKRHELAQLIGYAHWAQYATEDKMIRSAINVQSFIDRISRIARDASERDYALLLERKRIDFINATAVEDWEKDYYETVVKTERFAFDLQSVRPYFNFPDVQRGLFDVTQKLFGVTYRQVRGLNLWHKDVTAWDIYEGSRRLGRFYLDLHPRSDKYGHAAQFDYRTGVLGKRLPQAVLVCNFPNPADDAKGVALMEHGDVKTFFHEFGHLLHTIFAGHGRWVGNGGATTEWDFVEAPSQLLEEWCYDTETLQLFAKHYLTRQPIPARLVQKLRQASEFGKGLAAAHQMFYAAVSLDLHYRDPAGLDTTARMIELQKRYSPFPYVEGTHFQCGFGHLDGYSAYYYTYMWSQVIAKDLFSRFEREGLMNPQTALFYRKTILDPGGSKRAADLVQEFLGRPFSFDAFEEWLNRT